MLEMILIVSCGTIVQIQFVVDGAMLRVCLIRFLLA